jgi:hypothetical protein
MEPHNHLRLLTLRPSQALVVNSSPMRSRATQKSKYPTLPTKTISAEDEAFSRIRYLYDLIPTNATTPKRSTRTLGRHGTGGTPSRNVREIFVASSSIAVPQIYHRNELRGGRNDERASGQPERHSRPRPLLRERTSTRARSSTRPPTLTTRASTST